MRSNIPKLIALHALQMGLFIIPILVVFWQENGLSFTEIMVLQALFSVTLVVLEIPSGYAADLLGRKRTLMIGYGLAAVGMVVYSFGTGFWSFLAAELVLAAGLSFVSGTDTALLYDTLLALGEPLRFPRVQGNWVFAGQSCEAVAAVLGGVLFEAGHRLPFYATAAAVGASFLLSTTLTEPPRTRKLSRTDHRANLRLLAAGLSLRRGVLGPAVLLQAAVSCATLTAVWFFQPHWQSLGIPLALFGVLWAGVNFAVALTGKAAHAVERRWTRGGLFLAAALLPAAGFLGMGLFAMLWTVGLALCFQIARGLNNTLMRDELNRHTGSEMRATVNSAANMAMRLMFSAIGPALGWLTDRRGMGAGLLAAAAVFGVLGPAAWGLWSVRARALVVEDSAADQAGPAGAP